MKTVRSNDLLLPRNPNCLLFEVQFQFYCFDQLFEGWSLETLTLCFHMVYLNIKFYIL